MFTLLSQQSILKLPPNTFVTQISPAFNNTFVILGCQFEKNCKCLAHLDSQGNTLWKCEMQEPVPKFGMINNHEVILLNIPNNKIDIISLETYQVKSTYHKFLYSTKINIRFALQTFSQTKFLCARETYSQQTSAKLRLTYYNYEDIKEGFDPLIVGWQSTKEQFTNSSKIIKTNDHSQISWYDQKNIQGKEVYFSYFDLRNNLKGDVRTVKAKNPFISYYEKSLDDIKFSIESIWEVKQGQFFVVANTYRFFEKENIKKRKNPEESQMTECFTIGTAEKSKQLILKQTFFSFNGKQVGFYLQNLSQFFGFGHLFLFSLFDDTQLEKRVTYFANLQTRQIIAIQQQPQILSTSYFSPGYDQNIIIKTQAQKENYIRVTQINCHNPLSDIYLLFLLHLNEDFDDDLLQDAITLLV